MATQVDQDGIIQGSTPSNYISLGRGKVDPLQINSPNGVTLTGATVAIPGVLILGSTNQSLVIPAGSSAATNTTITIAGTTTGALLYDTKANGSLGTTAYTYNDLVRALKVAGVIVQ